MDVHVNAENFWSARNGVPFGLKAMLKHQALNDVSSFVTQTIKLSPEHLILDFKRCLN